MGDHPLQIDPHAIFEIESDSQGILISRMSLEDRERAFKKNVPNGLLILTQPPIVLNFTTRKNNNGYLSKQRFPD